MDRDVIYVVAMNTREIYQKVESLKNAVKNRMIKGLPVDKEHLANCSSMKSILSSAKKEELRFGGKVTESEMKLGANMLSELIIGWAND